MNLELVATAAFGLEAVVVRELANLGYAASVTRPGRISFAADAAAVCRANLWLRSADRVLIQLAEFSATDFDTLFETARSLPWEQWIDPAAAIPVRGRSHKSQLFSVPACQRTVKKAIVERLTAMEGYSELLETGPPVAVDVALLSDRAVIAIDSTGPGLHRRGYRTLVGEAQLRETLAAGMVQLSFWNLDRPLIDPFCGTGTIPIEAALCGRNLAPGRNREFAAEQWPAFARSLWQQAREEAGDLALPELGDRIVATDADPQALKMARFHAEQAGVAADIHFQQRQFSDLSSGRQYGCVITNPPYGKRIGQDDQIVDLYRSIPHVLRRLETWSHYVLSARSDLENLVGQSADRRRKLYNGRIACTLFQFLGPAPPKARYGNRQGENATAIRSAGQSADRPAKPGPRAFGGLKPEASRQATEFANRLRKRARHLRRWPTKRGITCYRLYERDIPEVPLVIDRYEDTLHIAEFERPHERTVAEHSDWLEHMVRTACDVLELPRSSAFVKHHTRQRGRTQYQRTATDQQTRIVQEGGLQFMINLSDYLDTGLFLDHRVTRGLVRDQAQGADCLNLFCYTGAFTVYAAAGGAAATTSVDLSPTYLDWAQENLRLNGFDGPEHRLLQDDGLTFVENLPDEAMFDLVVVDPPTFSNSKRLERDWDIQREHVALLQGVLEHLHPGGSIYFSTNSRRFKLCEEQLGQIAIRDITRQTIPEDFRNQRVHKCWRLTKE